MKRAAVFDIFDHFGLQLPPHQIWRFTDAAPDLVEGLGSFFRTVGLNTDQLRAGEPNEIARANELFELLATVEGSFRMVSDRTLQLLHERLTSGDFQAVRNAAEILATFDRIGRMGLRWPSKDRLAIFQDFLDQVDAAAADPLGITIADARSADESASGLIELMVRYQNTIQTHAVLGDDLSEQWPADWKGTANADRLVKDMGTFELLAASLKTDRTLSTDDIERILHEMDALNASLSDLCAQAVRFNSGGPASGGRTSGHGGSSSGAHSKPRPPSERETALAFFGFASTDTPSPDEIKTRYKKKMRDNNHDFGMGDEEEMKRRQNISRDANVYRDILLPKGRV